MAVSMVVFADISTFTIGTTVIEGIQSAQITEPAEIRPIYTWNKSYPVLLIGVPVLGNGSFSYIASDGAGSGLDEDFKTLIDGTVDITIVAGMTQGNSSVSAASTTITLTGCTYQGKSFGMNARNEGTCTVNFSFKEGLNG